VRRDIKDTCIFFHSLSLTCESTADELHATRASAREPHVQIQVVGMSEYAAGLYKQAAAVTICTCAAAIHLQTDGEYKSARVSLTGDFFTIAK
jgi:hypothetical protein